MSDRFNSNEEKLKITKLFSKEAAEEPVENLFPAFFVLPDQKAITPLDLNKILMENKIVVYKPSSIPTLINVDAMGLINPDLNDIVMAKDGKAQLPFGDTEFLPRYTPKHTATDYDLKLYKQIIYQWIDSPYYSNFEESMKKLVNVPKEYVFSSGTYRGQIKRLADMYKIADGLDGKFKPKSVCQMLPRGADLEAGHPFEAVARIFEYYLPLNLVEDAFDGNFPGLFYKPSYFASLNPDDPYDYLPKIGSTKIAGLPYIGKTKQEVILEALILADAFVQGVSDIIAATPAESNNPLQGYNVPHAQTHLKGTGHSRQGVEELLRDFWYLGAGQFFPKAERYAIADIEKKTRNIFAMSFPLHMIASLISQPVMDKSPNATQLDTPSLYAFSPFHGGMDSIINRYIYGTEESTSLIYADNWYIIYKEKDGTKTYFSIDQEKAEAQVQLDDFRALGYYLLTRGHLSREGEPAFNLTWLYLATTLLPAMFHNPTAVLQNQQFLIKGMGSGISWTFLMNHLRSSMIDDKWRRVGKPRPGSTEWMDKVIRPAGCNLKIELEVPDIVGKLDKLKADTPNEGYFQNNNVSKATTTGPVPYQQLDLLGWGVCWSHMGEMFVPVLEEERLFKSLTLPTKDDRHDYKDKPWMRYTYEVARCEAMRMVGGWRYAPIDAALKVQANEARNKLIKMRKLTAAELMEAFKMTEFGGELDIQGVNLVKEMDYKDFLMLNDFSTKEKVIPEYIKAKPWGINLVAPPPKSNIIPGASFLANLKIDDWLANKGFLGRELTASEMKDFLNSKEYTEAIAELQSFKLFLRNNVELPSTKPQREKEYANVVNPYPAYKLHSEHMDVGTTLQKTGSGATSKVADRLSKNQRRKANKREVVPQLIPGKDIQAVKHKEIRSYAEKAPENAKEILARMEAVEDAAIKERARKKRAEEEASKQQDAKATTTVTTAHRPEQPTVSNSGGNNEKPKPAPRKTFVAKVRPEKLLPKEVAIKPTQDIAAYLKDYYAYYGPSGFYKQVFSKLSDDQSNAVQNALESMGGDELLDKITEQL